MKVGWFAGVSFFQKPLHEWTWELKLFTVNITNLTKVKKICSDIFLVVHKILTFETRH